MRTTINQRDRFFLPLFCLIVASVVPAAQGATITAASCNNTSGQPDVQTAVNSAASGDTVIIPAGSCTWTQTLTITKPMTLTGNGTANSSPSTFGAGIPTTIITDQASNGLISVSGLTSGQFVRISLLDLEPSGSVGFPITLLGICNTSGCPLFRLDNILWGRSSEWTYPGTADTLVSTDNMFGVIDHNTVPTATNLTPYTVEFVNVNHTSWQGIGNAGDNSIMSPSTFGTDQSVYLENNSFFLDLYSITENEFPILSYPGAGGSRITARFNQLTDWNGMSIFAYHGSETSGRSRTGRQMEVYGNTINCGGTGGCNTITGVRGGVVYMFGNQLTVQSGSWMNDFGGLATQRAWRGTSWYECNGLDPYDDNDGYAQVWTGTLGSLTGGSNVYTVTVPGTPWTAGAFNFNLSSPGPKYYVVFDATIGWIAGIASNTANTLTTTFLDQAGAGSGVNYAAPGDILTIYSATLYAAGTHTGTSGAADLTDNTKSWSSTQWAPSNGHVYSFTDLTQVLSGQIASNTSNSATYNIEPYNGGPTFFSWNNGDVYIITGTTRCLDQGSAIGGQLFNATPTNTGTNPPANPVGATTQVSDPSYEFKDAGPTLHGSFGADSMNVLVNRDYFTDGANSSEWKTPGTPLTTGVAWGKLSNRPTSCSTGVGYWAYDQGNWNQSGNSFGQGELFVCTAPNTWALHYTPYTYPHPLISGAPLVPAPPTTMTSSFAPVIYPNPWRSNKHNGLPVTFSSLADATTVKIFTISGHKVREFDNVNGSLAWDLTNDSGDKVASGIYIYVIADSQGDKATGKVAVIR